ncbi:MAG: metalloregulator ArsR/SmtB family transcription factor [Candidatus Zixiibacteriota bacterium]|nr:MAG: metalloregulator ArsR/SmtB family transcription factor [candidate division Zixibacteria bacterium]
MVIINDHQVFKALSEPIRLRIAVLLTEGEICVCELTEVLRLPQSTVSRHMARLKSVGMVSDRRGGKWTHYRWVGQRHPLLDTLATYLVGLRSKRPHKGDLIRLVRYRKTKRCE